MLTVGIVFLFKEKRQSENKVGLLWTVCNIHRFKTLKSCWYIGFILITIGPCLPIHSVKEVRHKMNRDIISALETSPFAYWKFFASFDLFSFPWKKYRVNKPSRGTDALFQTTFTPYSNLSMYLRYRYKQKERDWTGSKGTLTLPIFHHQLRYRLNYSLGDVLSSRTTLDYNHFHSQDRAANKGYQVTQMISSNCLGPGCLLYVQAVTFLLDDYDSRVYASESGLLYTFILRLFKVVDSGVVSVWDMNWTNTFYW